jgi:hypothetical protein
MSPVLLQRKATQDAKAAADVKAATAASPSTSGLNISILELAMLMRQPQPQFQPFYPHQYPPTPVAVPGPSLMLLPTSHSVGPSLSLNGFCKQYDLTTAICEKLRNEGFTGSHPLQYVAIADLKEMGFKYGKIASLKDAVMHWSVLLA